MPYNLLLVPPWQHRKIANSMAEASNAKVCPLDKINTVNLQEYEIIGFGAGIAYGKHYDKLLQTVGRLNLQGKSIFVFSTSGMNNITLPSLSC